MALGLDGLEDAVRRVMAGTLSPRLRVLNWLSCGVWVMGLPGCV